MPHPVGITESSTSALGRAGRRRLVKAAGIVPETTIDLIGAIGR